MNATNRADVVPVHRGKEEWPCAGRGDSMTERSNEAPGGGTARGKERRDG